MNHPFVPLDQARQRGDESPAALERNCWASLAVLSGNLAAAHNLETIAAALWGFGGALVAGGNLTMVLFDANDPAVARVPSILPEPQLVWPLLTPGRVLGELQLQSNEQTRPGEVEFQALGLAAGLTALAITAVQAIEREQATQRRSELLRNKLEHQAFHDPLTNLPNRILFMDRVGHALKQAERDDDCTAVLFLDLDRFKVINDSLGHAIGDELLIQVTQRLQRCLRPGDTAARLGGDEFTVLLESLPHVHDAISVAERICAYLQSPFVIYQQEIFISTSIGIALVWTGGAEVEDLMRYAEIAMYRAKSKGRARYEVFEQNVTGELLERLQLETDMRRALERGEFRVYYQPKVQLTTGRVMGMEALVRWQHPQRGLLPPSQFIPLAEETGLILPLGRWVLNEACQQAKRWQDSLPAAGALGMAVNLSARQFQQPDLAADIALILHESQLLPGRLHLELTESMLMENGETTMQTLNALKQLGVQLAIDDFGTGYSSLSYLKSFPVDMLKIDRSFVKGVCDDRGDAAIVDAVIALARTLGMGITAEGVETTAQLDYLRAAGSDLAQGFLFAPPVDAETATRMLVSGYCRPEVR